MEGLSAFFERVRDDYRIAPAHVSLYAALLGLREETGCTGFMPIVREELMARSRILAKTTYYKTLKELEGFGFIEYRPEKWAGRRSGVRVV